MSIFLEHFPRDREHLIGKITGSSIIEEMTPREFKDLIIECLTGRNPRIYTETWAQSKIFHGVFSGICEMFELGKVSDDDFIVKAPERAAYELLKHYASATRANRLSPSDKILCQWICNLTDKGWDNILQANPSNLTDWALSLKEAIESVPFGTVEKNIVNMTIYNASLSKKGGLKSAMGNMFETLLLYCGLSACGLDYVSAGEFANTTAPCFTLNVNEGRQCDAQIRTGIALPSRIDIDIGFIGKGNPEIIADKTQRFGNMVGGGEKPLEHTITIVSAIPETEQARLVVTQASLLGAKVIAMSGRNWVYELAEAMRNEGMTGIVNIPSNENDAKMFLDDVLADSAEIVRDIPKNLSVPAAWTK